MDSERWDCRSCGGTFIGKRPADDICRGCVVTQVTTEPGDAELAEAERVNRIIDLTNEQRVEVLVFLAGTAPEALDAALESVARVTGAEGGEQR